MRRLLASRAVRTRVAAVALAAGLLAALLAAVYHRPATIFNVTATTERVEVWTGAHRAPSRWVFQDVEVDEGRSGATAPFSGSFTLSDSVDVQIDRVAMGTLWVNVRARRMGRSAGQFFTPDDRFLRDAPDQVDFYVDGLAARADSGRTVILALSGDVRVGRPVAVNATGSTAVLRAGKVTLITRSLFGSDVYAAGSADLDAGDAEEMPGARGAAHGFVVADERPALTAAYQVVGRRMVVIRNGGGQYPLTASFLERLIRDRLSQAVSFVFAILVVLVSLAPLREHLGRPGATESTPGPAPESEA